MNRTNSRHLRRWVATALAAVASATAHGQTASGSAAASAAPKAATSAPLQLQEVEVLGSRIRQTETVGPSPVSAYDRDYIRSTGAMTLADFLNYLPQNYSGISSGRGSAPNEYNPEFGQRTETTTPPFNFVTGSASAPPAQSGVSGVSLRGLGSGSTLVLVDGRRVAQSGAGNRSTDSRQGFVDLNTIPLGMIERVEVITDGASALYGADAVAGVINIVLKKNYVGNELTTTYKGTWHGGARERGATVTSGFAEGRLRGTVTLDYYDRSDLKASQRAFSKDQDHRGFTKGFNNNTNTPVSGVDLRLNWGYPALVQARTGTLTGMSVSGLNTPLALVPAGAAQTPALGSFIAVGPTSYNATTGAPVFTASGVRRGNTASFLDLVSPSERKGVNANFSYEFASGVEAYLRIGKTDTQGLYSTQPPVSTAAASTGFGNVATIVPAAFNPFGQDVLVGMIHYEFGSVTQATHTIAENALFGVRGRLGGTWRWDLGVGWQNQDFSQRTRDFNTFAITAALANPDPALRLNPFIDARASSSSQATIYERMANYNTLDTTSELTSFDLTFDGDVADWWGGTIKMATGVSSDRAKNSSLGVTFNQAVTPVATTVQATGARTSLAGFAEVSVPIFGRKNAQPLLQRLELQLAGRHEDRDAAGSASIPKIGLSWVPVLPVLIRGSYSEGFRAPGLTEYQVTGTPFTSTLTDPRRTPASTTGVSVTRGANAGIQPETSTNEFYGLVFEPPFAKGLNFSVNYYRTIQKNVIQVVSAQNIVNNEAAFPGRVVRATPDPVVDVPLGQPGRLVSVDTTLVNFGEVRNESIDYSVEYRIPSDRLGRFTVNATASNTLAAIRNVRPGLPELDDAGDTFSPPKWKLNTSIFWQKGPYSASVFATFLDKFGSNRSGNNLTYTSAAGFVYYGVPSQTKVDVRGGYEFRNGVFRGLGKGLRISGGIGNVFDEEPPFSDTVFGFNGALHSALGRTYEVSMSLPF